LGLFELNKKGLDMLYAMRKVIIFSVVIWYVLAL
jgi:hypothetical protein